MQMASDSLKKRVNLLSLSYGCCAGGVEVNENDDDE
jgi:hypothetical protein